MAPPRRASDNRLEQLQALADTIAALTTDDELEGDMSGDHAVDTLGSLISWARTLSDKRPDPRPERQPPETMQERAARETIVHRPPLLGDEYPFIAPSPPGMVPCQHCEGTGEVIDFPTETDERMVCCPKCGGQGELPA